MNEDEKKDTAAIEKKRGWMQQMEALAGVLKTLTWPIIVIYIIIRFNAPLSEMATLLPEMLARKNEGSGLERGQMYAKLSVKPTEGARNGKTFTNRI